MEPFRFSQQFDRRLHLIGIDRNDESSELIPTLEQLGDLVCQIRRTGYPEAARILGVAGDFSTPKIEAWLYALGPAKEIAIGTIELIATGVIMMNTARHLFKSNLDFCRTCLSFLIEAQAVESSIFLKFPQVEEGISIYEELCHNLCTELGVSFDEALKAAQE